MKLAIVANSRECFLVICKNYGWEPDIEADFIDCNNKPSLSFGINKAIKPEVEIISIDEMAHFFTPNPCA